MIFPRAFSLSSVCATVLVLPLLATSALTAQERSYSSAHRDGRHALAQTVTGGTARLRAQLSSSRRSISLAVADVDADGTQDLITGYATATGGALTLQRGNGRAVSPAAADWAMLAAGQPVTPFQAKAEVMALPVRPDFLQTADLRGHGHFDILAAAKGDTAVSLLAGRGDGTFAPAVSLPLRGTLQSLSLWNGPHGATLIAAGICGSGGCGIQLVAADGKEAGFVSTSSAPTGFSKAHFNNGTLEDLAVITADSVLILSGDSMLSGSPRTSTIQVSGAAAVAAGLFAFDKRNFAQVAVLGSDATLHVFARSGVDNRALTIAQAGAARLAMANHTALPSPVQPESLSWTEVETVPNVGSGAANPILLRGRFSGGGYDDLAVMSGSDYITVAHPLTTENGKTFSHPVVTVDSSSSPVIAAVATRLSADARSGIITADGTLNPLYTVPATYKTYTVNSTSDTLDSLATTGRCTQAGVTCSLRDAVALVNQDRTSTGTAKVDVVNIPGGTYTIVRTNSGTTGVDNEGNIDYHFDVDGSANFIGAGQGATIINANNLDKVFSLNSGVTDSGGLNPLDVFFSGLTIENGRNNNNPNTQPCAGGAYCDPYGGAIDWDSGGPGQLGFSQVAVTGSTALWEDGGFLYASNSTVGAASGLVELDNSTISNNRTDHTGGGLAAEYYVPVTLLNDVFSGNQASHSVNSSDGGYLGDAGAIKFESKDSTPITITNTTFSTNSADGFAGALYFTTSGPTLTNATFTNNTAGTYGGGIYTANDATTFTVNITASTFTGNAGPTNGGGICVEGNPDVGSDAVIVHYSRFHGNTSSRFTGVGVDCLSTDTAYATVNATDNWWGCNGPASGTGCDTAGIHDAHQTITLTPYTNLTLNLNTTTPTLGSNLVATASLGQDSGGTVYSAANDTAYLATPITTFTLTNTNTPSYNPSATAFSASAATGTSFAAATATGTTSSTTTMNGGTATLKVDGQTLTRTYTVTAPDLTATSTHSGNFKAGDTGDTYSLTVGNIGNASTSSTVTLVDTLPSGFTATAISGTGWTCTLATLTCTRSDTLSASGTYPVVTVTVSVSSSDAGTYTNSVTVSGGGDAGSANNTGTDATIVVGTPTITEAFSPSSVAPNANSTVTFTLGNPAANSVTLTGVTFTDNLPTGLRVSTPNGASTTCTGGSVSAAQGGTSLGLGSASIAPGATCTVTVNVVSSSVGSYTNTTSNVTASNSNAGGTATATLSVVVTPTRLVYTATPATPIAAGGNAGTVSVALEDASGNVATSNSSTVVTLSVAGPSGYAQTYNATANNGVASFNLSSVPLTVAGAYTYTASATGLTSAAVSETVNPGTFTTLVVTGISNFTAPGMTGTATVRATDSYGNTVTGFTGTVTLSSTDTSATFSPPSYTYTAGDAGTHNFSVSFFTAGTFSVTATSGAFTGSEANIVVADAIWLLNTTDRLVRLTDAGVQTTAVGSTTGTSTSGAVAFDNAGNVWATQKDTSGFVKYSALGTLLTSASSIGGLNLPSSIFLDGLGQAWLTNTGNNSLTALTTAGAAISPASGYQAGLLSAPTGLIVDSSGSIWITNSGSNSVVKIIGGAAPVVAPTVTGTATNTLGSRP